MRLIKILSVEGNVRQHLGFCIRSFLYSFMYIYLLEKQRHLALFRNYL